MKIGDKTMKKKLRIVLFASMMLVLICAVLMTACGKCKHKFQDGTCIDCGEIDPDYKVSGCTHSYVNGTCEKCGAACIHSYTNGICVGCGMSCTHDFDDGVCDECGLACSHTFAEGVCTVCGEEDPDYLPQNGRLLYDEIVAKYKYLILYKYTNTELPPRGGNEPFYMDALYEVCGHFDPAKTFGYSFKDIDGDGYDELLLTESTNRLYAMFSIKDKAPVLVTTFQSGMGYLRNDGTVFFTVKNGYKSLGNHITRLIDGELVGIAYGWEDPDDDISNSNDVYYSISEDGTRTELAKADYDVIKNEYIYYWENATRLTKLSNLPFHPALIATGTPDTEADFSTYDAVIKTFEYMHSKATTDKWVRSRWIGGAYDEGMIFENEEDFVIYNKLFAAYFLVTGDKCATVGYAMKDLNGDGVKELILLEGNFHVLAIFTQVDGAAVLLDSYNDLRTAFIDADGCIHVKVRMIPGYKNNEKKDGYSKYDYEAFVYEICDGKLVEKVAIGMKYDSEGNQKEIYKLLDGASVAVEQTEWNALYASYALELGDATFAEYTKQNAELILVAVPVA